MAKTKAFGQRTAQAKAKQKLGEPKKEVNWINLAISVAIGVVLWFVPTPAGLETQAWHMFAIFAATIVALIIKPMPMGSIAICAIALCVLTNTTSLKDGLSGFSNTTIWLIVIAFFISRGFIKTGLGSRVAYLFVNKFGKKTLGLSYALAATDLVLSPAMPSNTARAGGIVFPIVQSLSRAFGSRPDDGTASYGIVSTPDRLPGGYGDLCHVYDVHGGKPFGRAIGSRGGGHRNHLGGLVSRRYRARYFVAHFGAACHL